MNETHAIINLNALEHNISRLREITPNSQLIAVVKANAYGHGMVKLAQFIEPKVDGFAVARIEEGVILRDHGIKIPIILLEGIFSKDDMLLVSRYNFEIAIHNREQLSWLESCNVLQPIKVWLKIDTGMHRLGIHPSLVSNYYKQLCQLKNVAQIGIMSHFCMSDTLNHPYTDKQLDLFKQLHQTIDVSHPKFAGSSIAASGGILHYPESHLNTVRPGLIMYGISPIDETFASDYNFKPVMSLHSKLIAIRELEAGEPVGYGLKWCTNTATKIGVVALGYGDGFPRDIPEGTPVWINGRKAFIVGNISMDMMTVNLGLESKDCVGDEVEFWGEHIPIEELAKTIGVISYELVTKVTSRVKFSYTTDF